MKILIVDDELVSRKKLGLLVRSLGHETFVASDGVEGWEVWKKERPRMVITDWMMPRMDGLELCTRIREAEGNVINLTARLIIHIILSLVDFVITLKFASWANRLSGGNEDSVYFLDQLHNDIPWSFKKQKQSIFGF